MSAENYESLCDHEERIKKLEKQVQTMKEFIRTFRDILKV